MATTIRKPSSREILQKKPRVLLKKIAYYFGMEPQSDSKNLILSAKAAFFYFVVILLLYLISSFFLAEYLGMGGIFLSQVGCMLLPVFLIAQTYHRPLYHWSDWKKPHWILIPLTMIGMILISYSIDFLMAFQQKIWPLPKFVEEFLTNLVVIKSWKDAIIKGIVLAITPAFCEEILFRGFLQNSWKNRFGTKWAIFLTGLAFAIAHTNPWYFHFYLILGILLSLLKEWKNSLWIPIIAHATNNLFTLLYSG